ncbi:MAG: TIGR02206 family membrane protein [Clostridia bacterium]|nr:TIGR02206 family membrane protein [Clostridia bacterium]
MFFTPEAKIPEGVGFNLYDTTHLLWLTFFVLLCATCLIVYKKLNTKHRNVMRICMAAIVFILETAKNCVAFAVDDFGIGHMPFHLCGINVLLISFSMFKRTKTVDNFLYYIGIPGAMLALLTPDWTNMPCMNYFHMHSFLIHTFLVLYPFVLVASGDIKPELKMMPKCILLLIGFAVPALILNLIFDTNFMFLMNTANIGFLELFKNTFGAHQWAFPILLPIIMAIMYLPIFIANKIKKAKEKQKETVNA